MKLAVLKISLSENNLLLNEHFKDILLASNELGTGEWKIRLRQYAELALNFSLIKSSQ